VCELGFGLTAVLFGLTPFLDWDKLGCYWTMDNNKDLENKKKEIKRK